MKSEIKIVARSAPMLLSNCPVDLSPHEQGCVNMLESVRLWRHSLIAFHTIYSSSSLSEIDSKPSVGSAVILKTLIQVLGPTLSRRATTSVSVMHLCLIQARVYPTIGNARDLTRSARISYHFEISSRVPTNVCCTASMPADNLKSSFKSPELPINATITNAFGIFRRRRRAA